MLKDKVLTTIIVILISLVVFSLYMVLELHNTFAVIQPDYCDLDVVECGTELISARVTAYNSEFAQTDSTPHTTANGERVRYGGVANNCLSFGTRVEINGEDFVVNDRKNKRYGCEWFDIWMPHKKQAIEWGVKNLLVKVK